MFVCRVVWRDDEIKPPNNIYEYGTTTTGIQFVCTRNKKSEKITKLCNNHKYVVVVTLFHKKKMQLNESCLTFHLLYGIQASVLRIK